MEVQDENDNTPLTELPVYYPTVPENSPAGVSVLQLRAFDRDVSAGRRFVYAITSGNPEGYFLINATSGKCVPYFLFSFVNGAWVDIVYESLDRICWFRAFHRLSITSLKEVHPKTRRLAIFTKIDTFVHYR